MFLEHVERSFLDFQLGSRRKVGPIKNQIGSPNTSNKVREETFAQLRTGLREDCLRTMVGVIYRHIGKGEGGCYLTGGC